MAWNTKLTMSEVSEGDRVRMGVNLHGKAESKPYVEYDRTLHQCVITGTVTCIPRYHTCKRFDDGEAVLANFAIETSNGETVVWHMDNGYVLGPVDYRDPRTDIGKICGVYPAE